MDSATVRDIVRRHMPALDGLRGIAILMVIWYHTGLTGGHADTIFSKLFVAGANAGWSGVELFFVLSGFLITGILLDTQQHPSAWKNFIARRSLRIFPLYYSVLFLSLVVLPASGYLPGWLAADRRDQWWYWTYLANWCSPWSCGGPGFSHFWSLAVEEQFYLLWPIVALRCTPRQVMCVCGLLIVSAFVARATLPSLLHPSSVGAGAAYFFTFARWDALALGALVACALRDDMVTEWLLKAWLPLLALATAATLCVAIAGHGLSDSARTTELWGQTAVAALSAGLVVMCVVASPSRWSSRVGLRSAWLRGLGRYSYGLYVFHLPVAHLTRRLFPADLHRLGGVALVATLGAYMGIVILGSLGVAMGSWYALESPALRLKSHFS